MKKYRKKTVEVEAIQWFRNGDHPKDNVVKTPSAVFREHDAPYESEGKIVRYFRDPDKRGDSICGQCCQKYHNHGWIDTLEGGHIVCPSDYIITGIKGEHYPCREDIFLKTYELIS